MISRQSITFVGLAVIVIYTIAPIMRMTIDGTGILSMAAPVVVLFVFLSFLHNRFLYSFNFFQKFAIGLGLMSLLYAFITPTLSVGYNSSDFSDSIKIQIVVIILFLYLASREEINIMVVLNFAISFFFLYCFMFKEVYYGGEGRYYIIIQDGVEMDPNMTVAAFFVPMIYCLKFIIGKHQFWLKTLAVIYLGFALYATLLGASRSGLLSIIIGFSMLVIYSDITKRKKKLVIILSVLIVCLLLLYVSSFVSDEILARMTIASVAETGGSGRFELASDYINYFFSSDFFHLFFGYGWNSCLVLLEKSAHNTIIEYLMNFGLIGCGIVLYFFIKLFKYVLSSRDNTSIAILCCTCFWSLTLSANNLLQFWTLIYFALSLVHVKYEKN